MSELYDRYRLYFMLERKNERNNPFQHTSHLLSESVLRAARRRVGSGASPAAELPLWSKLRKFLPSVDTERRNGYNTYRVRPKRSAIYEQVFSPIRGITALRTAGRLFFSDRYGYRFCVTPQRNKKHDNQLNHTSHLLSDGVLTADCPWYYTCEYYNTYVYFCPYIENFPLYLLMKIGSKGRRPARRRSVPARLPRRNFLCGRY